jgi:hypothetical protein
VIDRRRLGGPSILVAAVALILAACGAGPSPSPSVVAPTPTVPASGPILAGPSPSPGASATTSGGASPGGSPAVPVDPSLLSVLPATVGGQQVNEVPEIEAQLVTDPSLLQNAAGLAVALGINMTTGDFAYVAVIQLKPLVFSNAYYASWRQSYDQGACSQSSGLKSTSTTTIAGRQVFVGTCNGGALTYHVHLVGPDRLVSITSVGTAGYGALVVAALRP